jgi:PAS domain S-box-containing protein
MRPLSIQHQLNVVLITCCVALFAFAALGLLQSIVSRDHDRREEAITDLESASFEASSILTRLSFNTGMSVSFQPDGIATANKELDVITAQLAEQLQRLKANGLDSFVNEKASAAIVRLGELREVQATLLRLVADLGSDELRTGLYGTLDAEDERLEYSLSDKLNNRDEQQGALREIERYQSGIEKLLGAPEQIRTQRIEYHRQALLEFIDPRMTAYNRRVARNDIERYENVAIRIAEHLAMLSSQNREYAEKTASIIQAKADIWTRIRELESSLENDVSDTTGAIISALIALAILSLGILLVVSFRVIRSLKQQEVLVAESNARLRDFARSTADVFWEMNAQGVVTMLEAAPESSFLVPKGAIVGRSVSQILDGQELRDPNVIERFKALLKEGKPFRNFIYVIRGTNGDWLWRALSGVPIFAETGELRGYRGSILDQTSRFHAEERFAESVARYQALANASGETFISLTPEAIIQSIDGFEEESAQIVASNFNGRSITDLLSESHLSHVVNSILEHISHRRPFKHLESYGTNFVKRSTSWYRVAGAPLFDPAGNYKGYVLGFANIDSFKKADQEAVRVKAQLDNLLNTIPGALFRWVGVHRVHQQSKLESISDSIAAMTGFTPAEVLAMKRPGITLEEDAIKTLPATAEMIANRQSYERRVRIRRKDGQLRWALEKGILVGHTGAGEPIFDGLLLDIHDMTVAEERMRDFATALDQIEDGVCINDHQIRVLHSNQAMADLADFPSAQHLLGKAPFDVIRPIDEMGIPQLRQQFQQARTEGRPWLFAFEGVTATGNRKFIEGSVTLLDDQRMISIVRDITARTVAEQSKQAISEATASLARNEVIASGDTRPAFTAICEQLAITLDLARAGVWLLEDDGLNLTCANLYEPTDNRHSLGIQIPVAGHEIYFEALKTERVIVADDARTHPATTCFTTNYLEPLGITSALKVPIRLGAKVVGVICCEHIGPPRKWTPDEITFAMVVADIAAHAMDAGDKREAQQRLAETVASYDRIVRALDQARDAILIVGADSRVLYCNSGVSVLFGLEAGETVIGKKTSEFFQPAEEQRENFRKRYFAELKATGKFAIDMPIRLHNGKVRPVAGRAMVLPDGGRIVVLSDNADHLAAEQQRRKLSAQLAQAKKMEAIGSLAGGIAHDFNNLVAATRSFAELIYQDVDPSSKSRSYAARIVKTCDRSTELVRQILTFARANSAEQTPIAVGVLLDEVIPLLHARIASGLNVTIPSVPSSLAIRGNASQLVQVLLNLCVNAADALQGRSDGYVVFHATAVAGESLDHLESGLSQVTQPTNATTAVWRHVTGAPQVDQEYVRISVSDNGHGISPDILEKILEPFFSTKTKGRGTGLGLAIVASVIAAHDGFLCISSQVGIGTTIEVYLPTTALDVLPSTPRQASRRTLIGNERIMIVDDEVDLADALSISLNALGYEALPVYDPNEAIELFQEDPMAWDIVVTDQLMPKKTGLELIAEIKQINPSLKIILYTGYSETANKETALAAGATAFLEKPVSADGIAQTIRHIMSGNENALQTQLEPAQ